MFLKNNTSSVIKLRSFEGYRFELPKGVSWIWDKAGEQLLKVYEPQGENGRYKLGPDGKKVFIQESVQPPVVEVHGMSWVKTGKQLARVERFKVDYKLIPRKRLIPIAKSRGIDNDRITEWLADESVDPSIIADAINALPIPDEIRFPKELGADEEENKPDEPKS